MTPYDLVPLLFFGALWIGAWRLDRREAEALAGKALQRAVVPMPRFMRDFEVR